MISEKHVLKTMDKIQDEIRLSHENVEDGRYAWPDRWVALRKAMEKRVGQPKPENHE